MIPTSLNCCATVWARSDHVASAAQGAELAWLVPYGLLILDVRLPEGIDAGYALGRRLREDGLTTPLLYLTARGTVED
ncbi:response regulator [Deinococcus marmoris]|uniref:response regulator n=1 Tax=Deinococcus marmoris TaxID=249408 RepID=UPI0004964C6D|nr:response regulator [Deinococcus marmoris]